MLKKADSNTVLMKIKLEENNYKGQKLLQKVGENIVIKWINYNWEGPNSYKEESHIIINHNL